MSVWTLYRTLTRRLLVWSGLCVIGGIALVLFGGAFWQGVGIQAVAWGGVDGIIAIVGIKLAQRRRALLDAEPAPDAVQNEANRLYRLLWVNAGLDVLYVAAGLTLAIWLGAASLQWRGHGWGIVVQGGFLLVFDLVHARIAGQVRSSA
jgi:hypothetical protein